MQKVYVDINATHVRPPEGDCHVMYDASDVDAMTDAALPPIRRTHANLWQSKYFEALVELRKANKGAARLRRRLDRALKVK